jgi:copper chaperone CopZ
MILQTKLALAAVAALSGAGVLCPLCVGGVRAVNAQPIVRQAQAPDTAVVRFHISGMTCGSCPVTARTALKKLPGVFSATVTLDDSLGVVRYDPRKVTPANIAAHLTRLTGYGARVIADSAKAPRRSGG